jgi:hypothetical protein
MRARAWITSASRRERADDVRFDGGDRNTVAAHDPVTCGGPQALAGCQDTREVQRVRGADDDEPPERFSRSFDTPISLESRRSERRQLPCFRCHFCCVGNAFTCLSYNGGALLEDPTMDALKKFVAEIKEAERLFFALVLSSSLFALLAVLAQGQRFSLEFKVITEIIGVLSGSAGVAAAFLGRIRHPDDEFAFLVHHRPVLSRTRVAISLFGAAGLFYLYYVYVLRASEASLIFLALGTFLVFYTLGYVVNSVRTAERQKHLWSVLSAEHKQHIRERQRELLRIRDDAAQLRDEGKRLRQDIQQSLADAKTAQDEAKRLQRREWWRDLRWRVGGNRLLTRAEQWERSSLNRTVEAEWSRMTALDWCARLDRIHGGMAPRVRVESAPGLAIFSEQQFYLVLAPQRLDESEARAFIQTLDDLVTKRSFQQQQLRVVIPANSDMSREARLIVQQSAFEMLDENELRTITSPPSVVSE